MITQIELDNIRIQKYQALKTNLEAVCEHFRVGDILVRAVNDILAETQGLIDTNGETAFTKADFNVMLDLRNEVLAPIFQNASFAAHFDYYSALKEENPIPVEPVPDVVETTVSDQVVSGILISSTVTTTVNSVITKTIRTSFTGGVVTEVYINEYSGGVTFKTVISKFAAGIEIGKVVTLISGSSIKTTTTNYVDNLPVSETTTTYEAGTIVSSETITL